jgi:coenzyme F420 hydrogenase subunit beta
LKILGQNQLQADVVAKGLCVGCGACVNLCPYFVTYRGKTSMTFPCTRETGRCHAHCPKTEVDFHELSEIVFNEPYRGSPMGSYRRVVSARAGKKTPKGGYQGGGTVSALLAAALASGLAEGAIVTRSDNVLGEPVVVTDLAGILEGAGSKYAASPVVAALNKAQAEGKRRLAVAGTPCQMTAIAQLRQNPLEKPDFADPVAVTIGIFCTFALDGRALEALIKEELGDEPVKRMDIPPPPASVLVVETATKRIEIPLDRVRPIIPKGCAICPDMTSEWSDVSVGMVEGTSGWNTLVIRTQAGDGLVEYAVKKGFLEINKIGAESLDHLITASNNKKKRAIENAESQGLMGAPDSPGQAAMRIRPEVVERIKSGEGVI